MMSSADNIYCPNSGKYRKQQHSFSTSQYDVQSTVSCQTNITNKCKSIEGHRKNQKKEKIGNDNKSCSFTSSPLPASSVKKSPPPSSSSVTAKMMSKKDFNQYMTKWLRDNFIYPYPDNDMVDDIATYTGRTKSIINNWLSNNRSRKWYHIMETVLQYKRPSDYFYEDCINLFDGKPLRVLDNTYTTPTEQMKQKQITNTMTSIDFVDAERRASPCMFTTLLGTDTSSSNDNTGHFLNESDNDWKDNYTLDINLLRAYEKRDDDGINDDDDSILSLLDKELLPNECTHLPSPLYHDDSLDLNCETFPMQVSPQLQEQKDWLPIDIRIEWNDFQAPADRTCETETSFTHYENCNASYSIEESMLLLPSFDWETSSNTSTVDNGEYMQF
jgi:hypothetical protein